MFVAVILVSEVNNKPKHRCINTLKRTLKRGANAKNWTNYLRVEKNKNSLWNQKYFGYLKQQITLGN